MLDSPGGRKSHQGVIPRGAGLVLSSGFIFWALFAGILGRNIAPIVTASLIVFVIGYVDDMKPVPPLVRLIFHFLAAAVSIWRVETDLLVKIILIFWVTGMTNAFNLIDGMNGLALSLASLTSFASLLHRGGPWWSALLGLCFGILIWNFPRAYTFLGDGGSTLLGFLCSSLVVYDFCFSFLSLGSIKFVFILVLLGGIPVLDTLSAMCRRLLRGRSPFSPDRGHFHHVLLDFGLNQSYVLLILSVVHFLVNMAAYRFLGVALGI
ncbi:glycosyltransferase family 4 protein [Aminirod propionatiphilus]|uniref:Undecaprenyl/decaprenyl-phosphate alpha-N-acetylglucosaminyl 1-phosphate transferase n=1 Tax=Aminirod propionatiphilus TaxID=3415223 RepID=A0ACD1DZ66_9BACT|nr:undecaprenyl/decaprenyl-phosphate alpha-N-acetylglucosaminyl 1-phosphate transferase [Synergistota bacterium]